MLACLLLVLYWHDICMHKHGMDIAYIYTASTFTHISDLYVYHSKYLLDTFHIFDIITGTGQ